VSSSETWSAINAALRFGWRGLQGGSSLHILLRERRTRLTYESILARCDTFYAEYGGWPTEDDKRPVPGHPDESWQNIAAALSGGLKGLPGGSSLPRLLKEYRGRKNLHDQSDLSREEILQWLDQFHAEFGEWPATRGETRPVPGHPDESWGRVDNALKIGFRGLSGGESLALLLQKERGRRNIRSLPKLTTSLILGLCDQFRSEFGEWPSSEDTRPVPGYPDEKWIGLDSALMLGRRGLPGSLSLAKLLQEARGRVHKHLQCDLTEEVIVTWMKDEHSRTGKWPNGLSKEPIVGHEEETWFRLNGCLSKGLRGLPSGSSIAILLERYGLKRHKLRQPSVTISQVVSWIADFFAKYHEYPTRLDTHGVPSHPDETWSALDDALRFGRRDLPKGMTLVKLLELHFDRPRLIANTDLDLPTLKGWAKQFHKLHGEYPRRKGETRPVPGAPKEKWSAIISCLYKGGRGLPSGLTIRDLQ
jgi:hypothetical protein